MTTVLDDKFLDSHVSQVADEFDNTPLPVSEDELVSLEEFKLHMENLAYERLGLKLTL